MTYVQLAYDDLILPALLVVTDGALSLVLRLKLEKQLAIATVRMVLQLVLVGYVLTFLFAAVSLLWTTLAAFIMVLFASREIVARAEAAPSRHLKLRIGSRMHAARRRYRYDVFAPNTATPRSLVSPALCAAFVGYDPG